MIIDENLEIIQKNIASIATDWNRAPNEIKLIAVSKRQPQNKLQSALEAGHRLFGENRVQEAFEHWQKLKPLYPDLKLHLIGPLQTNKVKEALKLFDVIETVDREKLARKIGSEQKSLSHKPTCLIQVNTGEEEQKSGIPPQELPAFLTFCKDECDLDVQGLMCIPPIDEPASLHFGLLQKLAQNHNLTELSMGMSSDYEKAIPLGATYIRVGTAIFGERT